MIKNNTEIIIGVLESYEEAPLLRGGRESGKDVTFTFISNDNETFIKSFHLSNFGTSFDKQYIKPIIEQTAYMLGVEPTLEALDFANYINESFILILNTRESSGGNYFTNIVGCIPITPELMDSFNEVTHEK